MNLADEGQQRNLKDFLLLYNKLTEQCFERCVYNLNNVGVSKAEVGVKLWTRVNKPLPVEVNEVYQTFDRYVTYNQKLMMKFMEHQNLRQQAAARETEAAAQQGGVAPSSVGDTPNS